jgi:hypothetical protein
MAGLMNYAEEKALEHFLVSGQTYTPAATVYVGLDTVAPDDAGAGGVEVTAGGYARQAVTFGSYASRRIASNVALTWTPSADWGVVTAYRIWDAASGGNALSSGLVTPNPSVVNGQPFSLSSGEVVVELTGGIGPSLAQKILELLFKNTAAATLAGSLHAHLVSVAPDNDGAGGTYLSASGYSSKPATFAQYASGRCNLASNIEFSAAIPASWGTIPAWVLRDNAASGSGNFLGVGALSPLPTLGIGAQAVLLAASTFVELD